MEKFNHIADFDIRALTGRERLVLYSIVFDPKTNMIWASEWGTNHLLRLDLPNNKAAWLSAPGGEMNELCLDGQGLLYIYDGSSSRLYIVDETLNVLRTINHDEGDATKITGTEDGVILCTRREGNFYLRRLSSSGEEMSISYFPTFASQQNFPIAEFSVLYDVFYVSYGNDGVCVSEETDSIVVHRVSREGTYIGVHILSPVSRVDRIGVTVSGKQIKVQSIHLLGMTNESNTQSLTLLCEFDQGKSTKNTLLSYRDDGTTTQFETQRRISKLIYSDPTKVLGCGFLPDQCFLSTVAVI